MEWFSSYFTFFLLLLQLQNALNKKWIGIVITRKPLIHHTPLSKLTSWSPGGPVWISFCSSLFMAFWASNRVLSINWTSLPARRCPRTNADCKKKITKLSLIFIWFSNRKLLKQIWDSQIQMNQNSAQKKDWGCGQSIEFLVQVEVSETSPYEKTQSSKQREKSTKDKKSIFITRSA